MKPKKLRRLFVDPASKSSGWALFEGDAFVSSGTVNVTRLDAGIGSKLYREFAGLLVKAGLTVEKTPKVAERLWQIYKQYSALDLQADEVHVEDVPRSRTCHIYVHYSIGVILAALAPKTAVQKVDIPVKAWQKHVEWDREHGDDAGTSPEERLQAFKGRAQSRDELAAVGMGLWYLANNLN